MSGPPPLSSPPAQRHSQSDHQPIRSQWEAQQHNDKLQIRVVPYSPPRISSGAFSRASSRPVSYADNCPSSTSMRPLDQPDTDDVHTPDRELPILPSGPKDPALSPSLSSLHMDQENISIFSSASSPRPQSSRLAKRIISVNSDKTFSLIPQSDSNSSWRDDSFGSTLPSSITPSSSWGRVPSNAFPPEDCSSSPLTPHAIRSYSSASASPTSPQISSPNSFSSYPWNTRMGEGVRRIDRTSDPSGHQFPTAPTSPPDEALPSLPEHTYAGHIENSQLSSKGSFSTSGSESTVSERTNYKTYGQSSPVTLPYREELPDVESSPPPSSTHSNYQILGESSPSNASHADHHRPRTHDSDANFILHGGPSASCSSLATNRTRLRSEYSRESLVVAPLRPVKQRTFERSGVFKSRSRESLRRGSLTSLGTTLTQEATRALLLSSSPAPSRWPHNADASSSGPHGTHSIAYQWSAPLSIVLSESEGGSLAPSRSLSPFSVTDRRSSIHSRNLLSMSSSLGVRDEQFAISPTSSTFAHERSTDALSRTISREPSGHPRLIRHYDEDGDGLADLDQIHSLPTKAHMASLVTNTSSERGLRSSGSTRSLNPFSLPSWARVYYGSSERRFLLPQASSDSMRSLYNGSMYNDPPFNHSLNRIPSAERFTSAIRNSRRRPRDQLRGSGSDTGSRDILEGQDTNTPAPSRVPSRARSIVRAVKKQTSSVWSPHLGRDRRASGYSIWDPPSQVWSTESGFDWRRNQQVILFMVGFLIPFAWMTAACLPLPPQPQSNMVEHNASTSHLELGRPTSRTIQTLDEMRYNSARWWRTLNRGMSAIGLLVIGAAIALIVVGVNQQWGSA